MVEGYESNIFVKLFSNSATGLRGKFFNLCKIILKLALWFRKSCYLKNLMTTDNDGNREVLFLFLAVSQYPV